MSDEKKNRLAKFTKKPKQSHVPRMQKPVAKKPAGKIGRPSDKDPDKHYVKLCAMVPFETKRKVSIAMLTSHEGKFKTQDAFVNAALLHYLETTSA